MKHYPFHMRPYQRQALEAIVKLSEGLPELKLETTEQERQRLEVHKPQTRGHETVLKR